MVSGCNLRIIHDAYQECRLPVRLELDVARFTAITRTLDIDRTHRMGPRISREVRRQKRHSPQPTIEDVNSNHRGRDVFGRKARAKNRRYTGARHDQRNIEVMTGKNGDLG